MCFELGTDSLTIIHPNDKNPLCDKNKHDMRQYLYGGVNVTGEKFSVGFVFRVVNKTASVSYTHLTLPTRIRV